MRDIENFSGGIRDEIVLAGPRFVPILRRDVGHFEFEGGMWDDIVQNATSIDTITMSVTCLAQENNTVILVRVGRAPLDSKSSTLNIRPPCLPRTKPR